MRSVLEQSFESLEVICVDDVSPDDSSDIVARLASSDSRIKLVRHESNLGQGGARNTAIALSQGEYIANVDSDDWMKPNMLEVMYQATNKETIDIVCCGYDRVNAADELIREYLPESELFDNTGNTVDIFELLNPALWNKLFRKSLCTSNNIKFPNYLNYEDLATTPRLVCEANYIQTIEDKLYNYVSRENSVVSTYSSKHMLDCFEAFTVLRKYLNEKKLLEHYYSAFLAMMDKHLRFRINSLLKSNLSAEQKSSHLRYYIFLKWSFLQNSGIVESMGQEELRQTALSTSLMGYEKLSIHTNAVASA